MDSNNRLDTKHLKQIVNEIVTEEQEKNSLNVNVFPVTFIEYYTEYLFKKKFSLKKVFNSALYPVSSNGFFSDGNMIVFLRHQRKVKKIDSSIFDLIFTIYHELRHCMQEKYDDLSYERFLEDLETYIRIGDDGNHTYKDYHDCFSYEIGANLYAIRKTSEYLKKNYPKIYELERENIETITNTYLNNYYLYDASSVVDLAVPVIRAAYKKCNSFADSIFINNDGSFKSIDVILENSDFHTLDKRIVAAILSSRTYLSELNFEALSFDELKIIDEAINYTYTVYNNQLRYIEKQLNNNKIEEDDRICLLRKSLCDSIGRLKLYKEKIELYMNIMHSIGR